MGLGVCSATRKEERKRFFSCAEHRPRLWPGPIYSSVIRRVSYRQGWTRSLAQTLRPAANQPLRARVRTLGFSGVTVANNHVLDHGEAYFVETVGLLREAGLDVFGLRVPSGALHCNAVVIESRGRRVGVLAYKWVSVDRFPAADKHVAQVHDVAVDYTLDRDRDRDRSRRLRAAHCNAKVIEDIRKLRPSVDHLVVMPHWRFEFVTTPPFGCTLEGRAFVEAGADLVVGRHAHAVQGYKRQSRGIIFYNMGKFLFDQADRASRQGTILTNEVGGAGHGRFRFDFTSQSTSCEIGRASSGVAGSLWIGVQSAIAVVPSDRNLR